jgi:hypothetical protein
LLRRWPSSACCSELSPDAGRASFESVLERARDGLAEDPHGYRREFVSLVELARTLTAEEIRLSRRK